jgi:hypothetical protein
MQKTILVVCLLFVTHFMYCQVAIPTSGGDATGPGGSSSYSVGQLLYTTNVGATGSVAQVRGQALHSIGQVLL